MHRTPQYLGLLVFIGFYTATATAKQHAESVDPQLISAADPYYDSIYVAVQRFIDNKTDQIWYIKPENDTDPVGFGCRDGDPKGVNCLYPNSMYIGRVDGFGTQANPGSIYRIPNTVPRVIITQNGNDFNIDAPGIDFTRDFSTYLRSLDEATANLIRNSSARNFFEKIKNADYGWNGRDFVYHEDGSFRNENFGPLYNATFLISETPNAPQNNNEEPIDDIDKETFDQITINSLDDSLSDFRNNITIGGIIALENSTQETIGHSFDEYVEVSQKGLHTINNIINAGDIDAQRDYGVLIDAISVGSTSIYKLGSSGALQSVSLSFDLVGSAFAIAKIAGIFGRQNGPTFQEVALQALTDIRRDISNLANHVDSRFDFIEEMISKNHEEVVGLINDMSIKIDLLIQQMSTVERNTEIIERLVKNYTIFSTVNEFVSNSRLCSEYFYETYDLEQISRCLMSYENFAIGASRLDAHTGSLQFLRDLPNIEKLERIEMMPHSQRDAFFLEELQHSDQGNGSEPDYLSPQFWARGVDGHLELIENWFQYTELRENGYDRDAVIACSVNGLRRLSSAGHSILTFTELIRHQGFDYARAMYRRLAEALRGTLLTQQAEFKMEDIKIIERYPNPATSCKAEGVDPNRFTVTFTNQTLWRFRDEANVPDHLDTGFDECVRKKVEYNRIYQFGINNCYQHVVPEHSEHSADLDWYNEKTCREGSDLRVAHSRANDIYLDRTYFDELIEETRDLMVRHHIDRYRQTDVQNIVSGLNYYKTMMVWSLMYGREDIDDSIRESLGVVLQLNANSDYWERRFFGGMAKDAHFLYDDFMHDSVSELSSQLSMLENSGSTGGDAVHNLVSERLEVIDEVLASTPVNCGPSHDAGLVLRYVSDLVASNTLGSRDGFGVAMRDVLGAIVEVYSTDGGRLKREKVDAAIAVLTDLEEDQNNIALTDEERLVEIARRFLYQFIHDSRTKRNPRDIIRVLFDEFPTEEYENNPRAILNDFERRFNQRRTELLSRAIQRTPIPNN